MGIKSSTAHSRHTAIDGAGHDADSSNLCRRLG